MIDEGRCVNIISKSVVEKTSLKVEPYPQTYVTWVNKSFHSII